MYNSGLNFHSGCAIRGCLAYGWGHVVSCYIVIDFNYFAINLSVTVKEDFKHL